MSHTRKPPGSRTHVYEAPIAVPKVKKPKMKTMVLAFFKQIIGVEKEAPFMAGIVPYPAITRVLIATHVGVARPFLEGTILSVVFKKK